MKINLESLAKRVARTTVQPLVPTRVHAEAVRWYYRLFGSRNIKDSDWRVFLRHPRLDPVLKEMMLAHEKVAPSEQSSQYWRVLNKKNVQQLLDDGFENFKRTVALNYFTFLLEKNNTQEKYLRKQLPPDVVEKAKRQALASKPLASWGEAQSRVFNFNSFLLWAFAEHELGKATLSNFEEPALGNPPAVEVDGRRISQDLANSVLEYDSIRNGIVNDGGDAAWSEVRTILELGAGYGRTAYVFQQLKLGVRYVIADIPPALYLSQRYLTELFPQKRAFRFREFDDFASVADEFRESELAFLMPSQLKSLPANALDLFLAIDCLHEMLPAQIDSYFATADRVAKSFYFTCRKTTAVAYDGLVLQEKDYPVRSRWRQVFWKERRVQDDYFEALFSIPQSTESRDDS